MDKDIEKDIRENWFKNHKATLINQGELQILDWSKPNTSMYGVRYVFDGHRMYITGDIGQALFELTWKATLNSFQDTGLGYFESKIKAFSDERRDFNSKYAVERLREWLKQMKDDEVKWDNDEMRELFRVARQCTTKNEWVDIVKDSEDFIEELDVDYWEWMYNAGDQVPMRIYGYLIGLKMAYEQLKEK